MRGREINLGTFGKIKGGENESDLFIAGVKEGFWKFFWLFSDF